MRRVVDSAELCSAIHIHVHVVILSKRLFLRMYYACKCTIDVCGSTSSATDEPTHWSKNYCSQNCCIH